MSVPSGPAAPAGWYPSETPGVEVYWDGAAYTGQTRAATAEPATPVQGPPGTHAGTGAYAGLFHDGKKWMNPDGTPVQSWMLPKGNSAPTPGAPASGGRSTGRTIGGIVALLVAAIAGLQAFSWFQGMMELQADGNQFSGMLAPLALGAGAVAAGFGIWGITLLSKK